MTLTIDARDLPAHVGRSLGTGRWLALQQHDVDGFAELTGDLQWGHIDVERAGRRPFGSPIVHGCFTLSLLPKLSIEICGVTGFGVGLNYGLNRVRFPAPLPVGGEFRLGVELHEVRSATPSSCAARASRSAWLTGSCAGTRELTAPCGRDQPSRNHIRSKMVAFAWPPPSHIDCSPYRRPVRCSS